MRLFLSASAKKFRSANTSFLSFGHPPILKPQVITHFKIRVFRQITLQINWLSLAYCHSVLKKKNNKNSCDASTWSPVSYHLFLLGYPTKYYPASSHGCFLAVFCAFQNSCPKTHNFAAFTNVPWISATRRGSIWDIVFL